MQLMLIMRSAHHLAVRGGERLWDYVRNCQITLCSKSAFASGGTEYSLPEACVRAYRGSSLAEWIVPMGEDPEYLVATVC